MSNSKIKVTIITVSYNSENTIADTIKSVMDQSYKNIEFILIDGKSTDATLQVVNKYNAFIDKIVSEKDLGIYDAMNKGVACATGDIIGILNSDDFYSNSDVIANVVKFFIRDEKLDILLSSVDFVKPNNLNKAVRVYSAILFRPWMLRFGVMPPHPGAFIKKAVYEKEGFYEIKYKICGDYDMFVRLFLKSKHKFLKSENISVRMRVGGISTSGVSSRLLSTREMLHSLKRNGFFGNYILVSFRFFYKSLQFFVLR